MERQSFFKKCFAATSFAGVLGIACFGGVKAQKPGMPDVSASKSTKPNIIFIMPDDVGYGVKDPKAEWADRYLFTHLGRWNRGASPEDHRYDKCAVRNTGYSLVHNEELYDLIADPGEKNNIIARQPGVAAKLRTEYDKWWSRVQPMLINEKAYLTAPKVNPFHEVYWKQFPGSPDGDSPGTKEKTNGH